MNSLIHILPNTKDSVKTLQKEKKPYKNGISAITISQIVELKIKS